MNPSPRLRRVITNIEILGEEAGGTRVAANMLLFETSRRGDTIWGARNEYLLRREGEGWRMAYKKVNLVNNQTALKTMAFLM
jgi:3-phenylpropionate/cinnamic acid dioxygenase small subunit